MILCKLAMSKVQRTIQLVSQSFNMDVKVLNNNQIDHRILRLAYEIYEQNAYEKEIYFLGINKNGKHLAKLIINKLENISKIKCHLHNIILDPAAPIQNDIVVDIEMDQLKSKTIIIVDDVANTGRTLYYGFKPLMDILANKVETAVLVDRKHKSFPVKIDYVGLSLSTTLQENIDVVLTSNKKAVILN